MFDYKLGHSRYCHFTYKLYKTRQDVFDCLIASFQATGGVKLNTLEIYFSTELIARHELSNKKLNYQKEHYTNLLSHYVKDKDTVAEIAQANLQLMDQFL